MGGRASSTATNLRSQMMSFHKNQARNKFNSGKYPGCFGKYPDCPEAAKTFAESKGKPGFTKDDAPSGCRACPFFKW